MTANQLHWFPNDPAKWRVRTGHLSPEARGAYAELRNVAWEAPQNGRPAGTLPNDDVLLARLSGWGPRWKKLAAEVRTLFVEQPGGLLLDADLLDLWTKQQEGYTKRKTSGAKGGKAKALRKQSSSNATANTNHKELELEEAVEAPSELLPASAPSSGGALALEGARSTAGATSNSDGPHDWLTLLEAAFPEQVAGRRVRPPSAEDVATARDWVERHPETHAAIAMRLAEFPVSTDRGRERMRNALAVTAWRAGTAQEARPPDAGPHSRPEETS